MPLLTDCPSLSKSKWRKWLVIKTLKPFKLKRAGRMWAVSSAGTSGRTQGCDPASKVTASGEVVNTITQSGIL